MKDRYKDRLFYAMLSNYSYTSSDSDLPSGVEYLGDRVEKNIRFCYFREKSEGCYYLAIRGTYNFSNTVTSLSYAGLLGLLGLVVPFTLGLLPVSVAGFVAMRKLLEITVPLVLRDFEERYGTCSAATGHSLGGTALEYLPERIGCVAFNALLNENRQNISSVRMHGDIAGRHTDHWIGESNRGPIEAHELDTVIAALKSPQNNVSVIIEQVRLLLATPEDRILNLVGLKFF